VNPKELAELVKLAKKLHISDAEVLDEEIHQLKSQEASGINNEGLKAQLEYMLESLGLVDAKKHLEDIKKDLDEEAVPSLIR
jgi:hypothetical protein